VPPFMGNELLRGERVCLARPTHDETMIIASWSHDLEYSRLLRRGLAYPDEVTDYEGWFSSMWRDQSGYPFAIRRNDDNSIVGFLIAKDIFWQARHCSVVIGIGDPAARGHGYGSDALRVLLKYAFLEMNLNRVGLEVMSYNEAGIRAYTKVGFQPEGRLRAFVYRDGVYYDIIPMSILRSEWEALYHQPAVSYPTADGARE
jgi:RimJ/RimL family protein N-acetyltransferase